MKMLRIALAGALTLVLASAAFAQVQPGTSPLSGAKGGTNNAFMQFTGPAAPIKTFTLPNVSGSIPLLAFANIFTATQTLSINQNASTAWSVSNNSAGAASAANFLAGNGTNNAIFGVGGTGNASFSNALQNRAYVYSSSAAAGIAVFADGANPINFYNNGALSGAFSSAGIFSLTTPLAAGSGGTGINSIGAGCATWLGTPSSANLRGCLTDESGTGSAYFQGGDIGTPSAGNGSNLTSLNATQLTSGTLAPGRTNGHMNGTATNDSAAAGEAGELISASVVVGSAVALTTNTAANITSISLTSGDWDVSACASFLPAGTTSVTQYVGTISTTSATLNTTPGNIASFTQAAAVPGNLQSHFCISPVRFSLNATTTVFLVSQTTHTVSTMGGFGMIRGRRMR